MKTFTFYTWLLSLLSQQSSERWAQLPFLLTIKIITGSNSSFLHLHINPPRPEMPLHSGYKKGRSRSKAPNWSLPYLSDRWIVHRPFTVSHASQHIPCGILCLRLQTVSSLSNYSWNQLFFRNPWSKMTVTQYFIHRNVQSTFTFKRA